MDDWADMKGMHCEMSFRQALCAHTTTYDNAAHWQYLVTITPLLLGDTR